MEHKNPFRFGRVVTERHFCDRHEELQRTVANLRSENSLLVHSPRRYGKTSLVSEAFAHVEGEIETGFVDLFGATDLRDFAGAWLRGLSPLMQRVAGVGQRALSTLRNLLSSTTLQLRVGPGGAPVFTIGHSPAGRIEDQELAELLDLPEALARKRNKWVVIALDEVQEVANVPGLDRKLRSAFQHHTHVSYVFSGSRKSLLKGMFEDPEAPFFGFAESMALERIAPSELLLHVRGRFEASGMPAPEGLAEDIVNEGQGHPHYTQLFASHGWELTLSGEADPDALRVAWRERVVQGCDASYSAFYEALPAGQRRVLRSLAFHGGAGLFSQDLRVAHRLGSSSTVAGAVAALVEREILLRQKDGSYSIANPALGMWARARLAPPDM